MKKIIISLFAVAIIVSGCRFWFADRAADNQIACPQDAKLCPDGSAAGRSGPNCEFDPCPQPAETTPPVPVNTNVASTDPGQATTTAGLTEPIAGFKDRITKKPFGIHITPQTSPVQPERFSGYHTGVDVEYADVTDTVPVVAVADGLVKQSGWVSGYGGVVAISHTINNEPYIAIYGHLNPDTLPAVGSLVTAGQQIGVLGAGTSRQTDGERKHLHFALYKGSKVNMLGYVTNQETLAQWIDPLSFFK